MVTTKFVDFFKIKILLLNIFVVSRIFFRENGIFGFHKNVFYGQNQNHRSKMAG